MITKDKVTEIAGFWKMHWYNFRGLNHDTHLSQSQKICEQSIQGNSYRRKGNHGMVSWIQTALGLRYISQRLFDILFEDGIQLVTGLRVNMKNKLMPFYDRMMLRKRHIIETINDMLKNTAQIVHSRHRSVGNFIMNIISALGAYCFFDNKPKALSGYCIEHTTQLSLF